MSLDKNKKSYPFSYRQQRSVLPPNTTCVAVGAFLFLSFFLSVSLSLTLSPLSLSLSLITSSRTIEYACVPLRLTLLLLIPCDCMVFQRGVQQICHTSF